MGKKILSILIFLMICILNCSCGSNTSNNNDDEILPMASYVEMTPEEISARSDCAIIGTYTGMDSYDAYTYYSFDVTNVLYGYVPEKNIYEYVLRTCDVKEPYYEKGQKYLLLLKKADCSIYDEYDYYVSASALIYFPVDGVATLYGKEFNVPSDESIAEYFYALKENTGMVDLKAQKQERKSKQKKAYDTVEEEIVGESEFIAYLTIDSIENEGIAHVNSYYATVNDMVVGDKKELFFDNAEKETIIISLAKDSVKPGKTYLIGFGDQLKGNESVPFYGQSTLHSTISKNDTEMITKLMNVIQ